MTVWGRARWQLRMLVAEMGIDFWLWLAGRHVPTVTLQAFDAFCEALPREPGA
jgi:hypothetical protein